MRQNAEHVLAALRTRDFPNLLQDHEDRESLFRDLLTALGAAGFDVVKPSTLEIDAPAQIKSCLRVAHYEAAAGHVDLAQEKITVALCVIQALEDYLRELSRLGTQVPITWAEFLQDQYLKKYLGNRDLSGNVNRNGSKNAIGILSQAQDTAEGC